MNGIEQEQMTATDRVYVLIRDQILAGILAPGERVVEPVIAAQLGVSRTPVREALRRLNSDGYVDLRAHAGAAVKSWNHEDVRSTFAMRADIEGHAAARAAQRITMAQLVELEDLTERIAAASEKASQGGSPSRSDLNRDMHVQILRISGLSHAEKIATQLMDVAVLAVTFNQFTPDQAARSDSDHRLLMTAFRQRDLDLAQSVMRTHILTASAIRDSLYNEPK